jgi:nitronate monooxygenase
MVRASIDQGIDIIFSGAGLPLDLPKYLNNGAKTKLVPIVSSGRAATILCNKWQQNYNYLPDAFVVEGPKAGGHLGFKPHELQNECNSLEQLMIDVLEVTARIKEKYLKNIPVIAAGGIFSGQDIFQIIKKGASAVQMGTRFIATRECDASEDFKQAFIKAGEQDIKIINSPVGMPGRAIMNPFLQKAQKGEKRPASCKYNCIKSCDSKTTQYCIAEALLAACRGDFKAGFAFSGSNGGRISKISTVRDLFTELVREYQQAKLISDE